MNKFMRIIHRYLGFFLVGIMAVYSISGIILILRDTEFLKSERTVERKFPPDFKVEELGRALRIRDFKIEKTEGNIIYFQQGTFDKEKGVAIYKSKELPAVVEKLTQLHKASTRSPLYFLNIFFGLSLLFFVISTFWMFLPSTKIFRKGLYFTLAGLVLTIILIYI